MTKKTIAIAAVSLLLVGCGAQAQPETSSEPEETTTSPTPTQTRTTPSRTPSPTPTAAEVVIDQFDRPVADVVAAGAGGVVAFTTESEYSEDLAGRAEYWPASGEDSIILNVRRPDETYDWPNGANMGMGAYGVEQNPEVAPGAATAIGATKSESGLEGTNEVLLVDFFDASGQHTQCEVADAEPDYQMPLWRFDQVAVMGPVTFDESQFWLGVGSDCEVKWKKEVAYGDDSIISYSDRAVASPSGLMLTSSESGAQVFDVQTGEVIHEIGAQEYSIYLEGGAFGDSVLVDYSDADSEGLRAWDLRTLDWKITTTADSYNIDHLANQVIFSQYGFATYDLEAGQRIFQRDEEDEYFDVLGAVGGNTMVGVEDTFTIVDSSTGEAIAGWEKTTPGEETAVNVPTLNGANWVLLANVSRGSISEFVGIVRSDDALSWDDLPSAEICESGYFEEC